MLKLLVVALLCAVSFAHLRKPDFGLLSDDHIDYINHIADTTWKAGRNFHPEDHEHVKRILGVPDTDESEFLTRQLPRKEFERKLKSIELPENFDPRQQFPNCPSLKEIRDQGHCGSCWAFAAAEAMTDRICIQSKGKIQFHFSAEDLLSCCFTCGDGCGGSLTIYAWKFFHETGVVSGGPYNSSEGCTPYEIPPCDHSPVGHLTPCREGPEQTPLCKTDCEASYKTPYLKDKHFGGKPYSVTGEENIMQELVQSGPVEAVMKVYTDFFNYKSGVYQYTSGPKLGLHAIKIIGYGVEDGTKYWLIANSWNSDWGDNGFFKILRGRDECGIESQIVAGDPKL